MASYNNFVRPENKSNYTASGSNSNKDKSKKQTSMSSYEEVKEEFRKMLSFAREYP